MKLGKVLAGRSGRSGKPQHEGLVEQFTVGIAQFPQPRGAFGRERAA